MKKKPPKPYKWLDNEKLFILYMIVWPIFLIIIFHILKNILLFIIIAIFISYLFLLPLRKRDKWRERNYEPDEL
ncbi:MAG: hypothetical protein WD607_02715 [Candidatus Paceibacterota bacterium]